MAQSLALTPEWSFGSKGTVGLGWQTCGWRCSYYCLYALLHAADKNVEFRRQWLEPSGKTHLVKMPAGFEYVIWGIWDFLDMFTRACWDKGRLVVYTRVTSADLFFKRYMTSTKLAFKIFATELLKAGKEYIATNILLVN